MAAKVFLKNVRCCPAQHILARYCYGDMEFNMDFDNIMMALGLTLVAGMSTGIGSLMAFVSRSTDKKFLSWALGLSAGVMVCVSFMEMLPEALEQIAAIVDGKLGTMYVVAAFFVGIGIVALIDYLVPEDENPHELHTVEQFGSGCNHSGMHRTGMMMALAIAIHNFPEGIATFVASMDGLDVALPIVLAIAIHNIPEGVAVSMPVYHATGSRRKALMWSLLSGLAEPLGAVFAILFILPFWTPMISALILAAIAGIMVYISFDELLPGSERYGHHHLAIIGVIAGMAFMAGSLLLF